MRQRILLGFAAILLFTNVLMAQSPNGLGRAPSGSYFSGNIDSINLYNGNVIIDLPIFSRSGRELSSELRMAYNSQGWRPYATPWGELGAYEGGFQVHGVVGSGSAAPHLISCDDTGSPYYDPLGVWEFEVQWTDGTGASRSYEPVTLNNPVSTGGCDEILPGFWTGRAPIWLSSLSGDRSLVRLQDGEIVVFLENGLIVLPNQQYVQTRNGNIAFRDSNGVLTDTLGRSIVSAWSTSSGHPILTYTVHDSSGTARDYVLTYTGHTVFNPIESTTAALSLLTSITLPNSTSYSFEYAHDQGFLTKVVLPTGGYIAYDYHNGNSSHYAADNYVVQRRVSVDGTTELPPWTYNRSDSGGNRTMTVTDPEGHQIVHIFAAGEFETETQWKENSSASASKVVQTSWYGSRPMTIVTQIGSVKQQQEFSWSGPYLDYSTQSDWYPASGSVIPLTKTVHSYYSAGSVPNDILKEKVELQQWNGSSYVTQGLTKYYYDEYSVDSISGTVPSLEAAPFTDRNNLTTVRRYSDASTYLAEHFHYDVAGNVVEHVDERGTSTIFDFTDNFSDSTNRNSHAYPKQITVDPSGLNLDVTTTLYDYNTGLPMSVADARTKTTTFTYDLMNRPDTVTDPNGGVTDYDYNDSTRTMTENVLVASGKYRTTETTMDKLGRPIQTKLSDPGGAVYVDTVYGNNGGVSKVSQPYRSGTPVFTQTTYDVLGRPLTLLDPDAPQTFTTYLYDGNTVKQTDAAGNQRLYTSNALGQLTKVEEYKPDLAHALVTEYSYYVFGPLQEVTQYGSPGPLTRSFTTDWLGRTTSESHPESGTTSYTYDGSLVTTRTDSRSTPITTTYGYDAIGRLQSVNYSDSTPDVTYAYDAIPYAGLLTSVSVAGVTSSSFDYDDAGQLLKEEVTRDGFSGTFTTEYTYDLGGRLLTAKYPSGRVVTQTYAESGAVAGDRLATLTDGPTSAALLQSTVDNAAGLITGRTLSSGITETRSFNSRNQLTGISAAANSTTVMDIGYGYGTTNNNGKIRARTDAVQPEHSANYTYDEIGRLTAVNGGTANWGITYTLDDYGNRTVQTPRDLAITNGSIGSQAIGYSNNKNNGYTYDGAGNVVSDGTYNYYFDAENRIYMVGSSSIQYSYDEAGRRIKKLNGGVTTHYFYGLTGLMSEFSTTSGATEAASSDRIQYRVGEQTGTAVMLIAADGTPRENNRVFPFGEPWNSNSGSDNTEKFTTYQRDGETDLDYAMARYYANRSGRFLSPDPGHVGASLGDPQSWNAYVYVSNDPINTIDPSGLLGEGEECLYDLDSGRYSAACPGHGDAAGEALIDWDWRLKNTSEAAAANSEWLARVKTGTCQNTFQSIETCGRDLLRRNSTFDAAFSSDDPGEWLKFLGLESMIKSDFTKGQDKDKKYTLNGTFLSPSSAIQMLKASGLRSGLISVTHGEVGGGIFTRRDYRQHDVYGIGSLQVVVNPNNGLFYADVDRYDAYAVPGGWLAHVSVEVVGIPLARILRR